jgi:hypothetical protein
MAYMECRHIKSNGCKCEAPALRGMPYCYFHMRLHRALHSQKAEPSAVPGAVPAAASDVALDLPAVEDRTAVQLALTQVLQGLGSKSIDSRRASQLLYGLQIASQLLERPKYISRDDYVQILTTNRDGDEIGPDKYVCDHEDCNKCPFATKDQCTRWHYIDEEEDEDAPAPADADDDDDDDDEDEDDAGDTEDDDTENHGEEVAADQIEGADAGEDDDEDDEFAGESTEDLIAGLQYLDSIKRQAGLDP